MLIETAPRTCQILRTSTHRRAGTTEAYLEGVNLAIEHIISRLDQPVRLRDVARAARFSPYHFHRVFQSFVGETPFEFATRLRLDRALVRMAYAPREPLTRVALDCGFASLSDLSRAFRKRFGVPPRRFDLARWRQEHRDRLESLVGIPSITRSPPRANPDGFRVRIREIPPREVAYVRVANPYKGGGVIAAAARLVEWAEHQQCADGAWLGFQWDSPELVPLERCVYHVGVVAGRFRPTAEVGRYRFPRMLVAEVEVLGSIDLELRALQWLYSAWLPRSGYLPDDHPCFEAWVGRPFEHGTSHFHLHAQLPIRR